MPSLNPITRTRITPPREGDQTRALWKALAQVQASNNALVNTVSAQARDLAKLKTASQVTDLHPFKIYQLPPRLRKPADYSVNDWRKFRVRQGHVFISNIIAAVGCDGANNPDIQTYLDNPDATDILVPANTLKYYVWLSYSASEATLHHGIDPATAQPDPDTWPTFPSSDGSHILIGWVDTQTSAAANTAIVTQLIRADIYGIGSNGQIQTGELSAVWGDYLDVLIGGVHVAVAKPYDLRNSVLTLGISNNIIIYRYPHNPGYDANNHPNGQGGPASDIYSYIYRQATANLFGANQSANYGVTPPYMCPQTGSQNLKPSTIIALPAATGVFVDPLDPRAYSNPSGGGEISYQEIMGRQWSKNADQTY